MTFAAAPLWHAQAFLAPESLHFLVIDMPAFTAGIVIGGAKAAAGIVFGVAAQPGPQLGVGVLRGGAGGFVALGGAMLPGHAAGEPFADPQHGRSVDNNRQSASTESDQADIGASPTYDGAAVPRSDFVSAWERRSTAIRVWFWRCHPG